MVPKGLKRKDSIEKIQQDRIWNLEKQSTYFGSLLTASLPRYIEGNKNNDYQVSENIVHAKRLYFADSPQKSPSKSFIKVNNQAQSPLKLKKMTPKAGQSQSLRGILKTSLLKSSNQGQKPSFNKAQQTKISDHQKQLHPYSILIKLQRSQAKLPQQQKITYQYRKIHDLKSYSESEIDGMIDELLNKCKISQGKQKLSVTDQFILSRFFDLKVRKALEKKKQPEEQKNTQTCKPPSKSSQKQTNPQIIKSFEQIKFVWDFYEKKLKYCPDLIKGNSKDQFIYGEVKMLYLDLVALQDQIRQSRQQEEDESGAKDLRENKRKKANCHPKKMTEDVLAKKIKNIMKKFKEIMVSN